MLVVSSRYEQASLVDRNVHHADLHTPKGASYRLKHLGENALPSIQAERAN